MHPKEGDAMGEFLCILGVALVIGLLICYVSWYKQNLNNNAAKPHIITHHEDDIIAEIDAEEEQDSEQDEEDEEEDEEDKEDKEDY